MSTPKLSPREQQVLKLFKEGKNGVQIAKELFLSPKTIHAHKARICIKLEIRIRDMVPELLRRDERDRALAREMLMDMNDELDPGDCAP